jgi:hypothetical protein
MNETRRESDFRNIGDILGGLATSIPRLLAGEAGNRAARSEERIRSRRDQSYLGAIGRELCRSLPGNVEDPETVLMKANERGGRATGPLIVCFLAATEAACWPSKAGDRAAHAARRLLPFLFRLSEVRARELRGGGTSRPSVSDTSRDHDDTDIDVAL